MHGKIYEIDEIPEPEQPLYENCRCFIELMKATLAGEETAKGKTGADWWLVKYGSLPPYYIKGDEAKDLGWRPKKGNLHSVAPEKMVTMGDYDNDDGHLPSAERRKKYTPEGTIVFDFSGGLRATEDHHRRIKL